MRRRLRLLTLFGVIHSVMPTGELYLPWRVTSNAHYMLALAYLALSGILLILTGRPDKEQGAGEKISRSDEDFSANKKQQIIKIFFHFRRQAVTKAYQDKVVSAEDRRSVPSPAVKGFSSALTAASRSIS